MAYVPGDFKIVQAPGGISAKPGHVQRRTMCLRKFEGLFGNILKQSTAMLMPSSQAEAFGDNMIKLPQDWQIVGHPWGEGKTYSDEKLA